MKKHKIGVLGGALMIGLGAAGVALAQTAIDWYSIDAGGGISSGGGLRLIGVIGQADTVRMNGGAVSLSGGYLALGADTSLLFKDSFE